MSEYAFITHTAAPWVQHGSGTMTPSRLRSLSPLPTKKEVTRSISVPQLAKTAHSQSQALSQSESDGINTIPDPRSATPQPMVSRTNSNSSQPDLSQEVSMLSTKLINAINHSTMLDDSLQQTRHDLEHAKEKLARLEVQVKEHEEKVTKGLLMDRIIYDKMEKQLSTELQEERKRRVEAEKAKRKTDSEVEALTAALFEEANGMVAAARKETEAAEKRGEQLKQQISDAEVLQHSMQEQLQDLKAVVEKMSIQGEDESNTLATTTAPSTPGILPADKMSKLFEAVNLTPNTPGTDEISPDHPLSFSHLIYPVLRSDLVAVTEFQDMLKISARSAPASRVSSGNYGSLNVLGLGSLTNGSTSSLPGAMKSPTSAGTNSPRDSTVGAGMPNLKDEKFYKRALIEDIEPTLRLDIAPGLSWMARRTVLSSITAGSLVVEPNPTPTSRFRTPVYPCSLCGEGRMGPQYARKYRFKPADNEEAQRYPLCDWCLGRIRATCDYIGFLRLIAAGHWRAESEDEKKTAWEESVRLRERMFWARLGGGVVPSFIPLRDSSRSPTFANASNKISESPVSEEGQMSIKPVDVLVNGPAADHDAHKGEDDPFRTKDPEDTKRILIGKAIISASPSESDAVSQMTLSQDEEQRIEAQVDAQLHAEVRKSLDTRRTLEKPDSQRQRSSSNPPALPQRRGDKDERLSLQIPGSFV